jgi:hypothetical protein
VCVCERERERERERECLCVCVRERWCEGKWGASERGRMIEGQGRRERRRERDPQEGGRGVWGGDGGGRWGERVRREGTGSAVYSVGAGHWRWSLCRRRRRRRRCKALAAETLLWFERHGYCQGPGRGDGAGAGGGEEWGLAVLSMGLSEYVRQVCTASHCSRGDVLTSDGLTILNLTSFNLTSLNSTA